eukprot:gene19185-10281_t
MFIGGEAGGESNVGYSGNPRQNPRQAPYVEKPVTDEPPLVDTEEARLNGQSLRRFVRNAVTNEMRQREATLEGKASRENTSEQIEKEKAKAKERRKSSIKRRGSKKPTVVKCEIEGCKARAIIHPNGAKLCGKHKADDFNTRGRVSLKALGFKMDWKRAKKIEVRPVALAQLRACSSTLSVMEMLACRPKRQDAGKGHDYKVFGVIDDSRSISQTPYLLLDTVRFSSSKKCVPLTQMLIEYMGVKPPLLVVSITGADFNSTIDLKAKIKAIMDSAVTKMKNVWFITTGLGAGVSAMVGRAVADFRKMLPGRNDGMMPVIGIIPWSDVPEDRRAKLGEDLKIKNPDGSGNFITQSPRRVEYTAAGTPQWPDLDDCHTHYFFARDGSEDHNKSQTCKQQILDDQQQQILDDQRAANRLTKDLEDALKEEVKYMEHLRKWRR